MPKLKTTPTIDFETTLYKKGIKHIAGIDEVGRGSWAGPLVVGAVIFHPDQIEDLMINDLAKVNDSKLVNPKLRTELSEKIKTYALSYSIIEVELTQVNKIGIGKCTQLGYELAVNNLEKQPDHILMDAFYIENLDKSIQTPIIKGDQKSFTIAAASIIAKVYRDELLNKYHETYPNYRFDLHKGYGTELHREMIKTHGLCNIHRTSFNLSMWQS